MLGKIDHVALAVADVDATILHLREVWGLDVSHRERNEDEDIEEAMLPLGESFIQLIAPTASDTTVARFIERRGEGLHHIAYEVDDLRQALEHLHQKGVRLIDGRPRAGGRGRTVAWVHPESNHGVLVELIQRPAASG